MNTDKKNKMMRRSVALFVIRVYLCVSVANSISAARAAPPTLTSLFPAGAQVGTTVEVTATGTFERWPVQTWASNKGVVVKAGKDKGKLSVTVAPDAVPGTCWIRLVDEQGASAVKPFLLGTLPEVREQEPNDDYRKPQVLPAAGVTINGKLEKPGDVDCFAVPLRKGQTLVASLEANHTLGSPMDGVLQVLSADGFVLQENNDYHGLDPEIVFTVPKDGTYVVRTFAFPSVPDASVRLAGGELFIYRLTLTTGGFADHAFPLAVPRSEPGQVELIGWNIPDAAKKLAIPQEGTEDRVSVFHAQLANAVDVRLEPHPTLIQAKLNDRQHPQAIGLPVTISGRLERKDEVHFYQFEGKKGEKLFFQVESRAIGFPLEGSLRITDAADKVLAQAESTAQGRDPELAFTVPLDGPYRINLRDFHSQGGPRHLYRLRALAEPDFDLTLATDRFVMTAGKPLDIPLTIVRRHGFDREIELTVEGLPAGATATTVSTGPAATAKTVTLRLTAEGAPPSGPIRISGKSKGKDEPPRTAKFAVEGLTALSPHVWLTIPAARP
jgi:hypothetical protein